MKFSYWFTFHVNIFLGSGVMTIFFFKGLTRNPEIGNTLVWVLPNIWILGQVGNTKFGTDVSNKILLNAAKFQGCSFYRFWVNKGKPTGGRGGLIPPPPPQIRVKAVVWTRKRSCKLGGSTPLASRVFLSFKSVHILKEWVNFSYIVNHIHF